MSCVASQRLVGYANNANPPDIKTGVTAFFLIPGYFIRIISIAKILILKRLLEIRFA